MTEPIATQSLLTVLAGDGTPLAPALPIAGQRRFAVAATIAIDGSARPRARHSVPLGATFDVQDVDGHVTEATVVRSTHRVPLTTLQLADPLGVGVPLIGTDVPLGAEVRVWGGNAWLDFAVASTGEFGPFYIRRLQATSDPELSNNPVSREFLSSPVWSGSTLLGIVTAKESGGRLRCIRVDTARAAMPTQSHDGGSPVYEISEALRRRFNVLHGQLKQFNPSGITPASCQEVQAAYDRIIALAQASADTDSYGEWLVSESQKLKQTYVNWNDVTRGPAGEHDRTRLWRRLDIHKGTILSHLHVLDDAPLRVMLPELPETVQAFRALQVTGHA